MPAAIPTARRHRFRATLAIALVVSAAPWAVEAQTPVVRGRVTAGGTPIAGVLVSDGHHVVRTDVEGKYQLAVGPDSGRFVFVSIPPGYWIETYYTRLDETLKAGRADFELTPKSQPQRFDFVFMCDLADLSMGRKKVGVPKTKASIVEANGLSPTPAFIIVQGDICIQAKAGKNVQSCFAASKIPVRVGIGNHEIMVGKPDPYGAYEKLFGPTYYSFDWGRVHFVILNGNKPMPRGRGNARVHGAVEGRELAWLRADLAAQPEGKPIVVGVHIPIVSTYAARRTDLDDGPFWESPNDKLLIDLFSRHKVRLVLQGHMHENERITVGGVEYVSSVSLSGTWWHSGRGFERATDGCPRGYRVVSVDGTKITHRYRSSCESRVERRGEFVRLRDRIEARRGVSFTFNCYDAPNGSTAAARFDDGPWRPMAQPKYRSSSIPKPHHFRLSADTTKLKPGKHTIEARVVWPDGTIVVGKGMFVLGTK